MGLLGKMVIFICVLFFTGALAELKLQITYKTDAFRLNDAAISHVVLNALKTELAQAAYSEGFVYVYSKQNGKEQYLVVNLLKPNTFGITSFRLDLYDSKVVLITPDYVEEEPLDPSVCSTCPDPELQVVVAYITDFASTPPEANRVKDALTKAGIKFVLLKDSEESKTSILKYLACPKLIMWARVGHGAASGAIMFGYKGQGGSLTTKDVTTAPFKDLIKGKYYPFNCCFVGGNKNTFGKGMISSGAIWMCAGDDVTIYAGSSEPVWANFTIDVCTKSSEVIATFDKYMRPQTKDKWRYQSQGSGPYYPFQQQTALLTPSSSGANSFFSLSVTSNTVNFNQAQGTISIYGLTGKLIHEINSTTNQTAWDRTTTNNQSINAGMYIAVLTDKSKNKIKKPFTILK
ncbi:MAG: T9SS type A sorting domain-containing protein [Chitinivibrionales bacterium]|nr:T9SS type A sorting domain-containing protein [Chitinivibrionales bacterium]